MRSWIYHDLLHLPIVVQEQKKKKKKKEPDGIASIHVVQAWQYKSYENEIEWSEGNSKIFIPSVFTEKKEKEEGKKSKKSEWQRKQERRNEIEYWRGDSRIKLNSEWSPIPKIVFRTFQPRISYAYVQHSSRYFRISPSKKRCDTLLAEILRCRDSSISRSLFFFSSFFFILLEIDPAGSSFSGEIFLSPGVNRGILFWIENKRRERRRSVKYFKVSMWDFLNCSPSGIGMNTEVEEFWWILCAQCSMIWRYLKDVEMQDWKNDERYSFFIVLFYLSVGKNDDRCKFSIDYYMVNCDTYIKWSWFKLFSGLID